MSSCTGRTKTEIIAALNNRKFQNRKRYEFLYRRSRSCSVVIYNRKSFKTVNGMSSCTGPKLRLRKPPRSSTFQNRKRYEFLYRIKLASMQTTLTAVRFQNRKRYEFLYRQAMAQQGQWTQQGKFQNRKRYEFLYRRDGQKAASQVSLWRFKTVNGMSSCTGACSVDPILLRSKRRFWKMSPKKPPELRKPRKFYQSYFRKCPRNRILTRFPHFGKCFGRMAYWRDPKSFSIAS